MDSRALTTATDSLLTLLPTGRRPCRRWAPALRWLRSLLAGVLFCLPWWSPEVLANEFHLILVDTSGSMANTAPGTSVSYIEETERILHKMLKEAPADWTLELASFDQELSPPLPVQGAEAASVSKGQEWVGKLRSRVKGRHLTYLWKNVDTQLKKLLENHRKDPARRAILHIFSDGLDTEKKTVLDQVIGLSADWTALQIEHDEPISGERMPGALRITLPATAIPPIAGPPTPPADLPSPSPAPATSLSAGVNKKDNPPSVLVKGAAEPAAASALSGVAFSLSTPQTITAGKLVTFTNDTRPAALIYTWVVRCLGTLETGTGRSDDKKDVASSKSGGSPTSLTPTPVSAKERDPLEGEFPGENFGHRFDLQEGKTTIYEVTLHARTAGGIATSKPLFLRVESAPTIVDRVTPLATSGLKVFVKSAWSGFETAVDKLFAPTIAALGAWLALRVGRKLKNSDKNEKSTLFNVAKVALGVIMFIAGLGCVIFQLSMRRVPPTEAATVLPANSSAPGPAALPASPVLNISNLAGSPAQIIQPSVASPWTALALAAVGAGALAVLYVLGQRWQRSLESSALTRHDHVAAALRQDLIQAAKVRSHPDRQPSEPDMSRAFQHLLMSQYLWECKRHQLIDPVTAEYWQTRLHQRTDPEEEMLRAALIEAELDRSEESGKLANALERYVALLWRQNRRAEAISLQLRAMKIAIRNQQRMPGIPPLEEKVWEARARYTSLLRHEGRTEDFIREHLRQITEECRDATV